MVNTKRYFLSLLIQLGIILFISSALGLCVAIFQGGSFAEFGFIIKESYAQWPLNILYDLFMQEGQPGLYYRLITYSYVFRFLISLLISLLSIRFKYRYAIIGESIVTLICVFLFVCEALQ